MQATTTPFRVTGLSVQPFEHLFGLSDEALAAHRVVRYRVDAKPGYPDRVELRDAEVGESVLLVNHAHLPDEGPYRSSHAIFVIEGASRTFDAIDVVPEVLRTRTLSVRAFGRDGLMVDADLVDGRAVEDLIARFFRDEGVVYLHMHYAKRGCFACRVDVGGRHFAGRAPRVRRPRAATTGARAVTAAFGTSRTSGHRSDDQR